MKTKRFDCVDMMHRGAKRIYRDTKDLSRQEELEYWRHKATQLLAGPAKKTGKAVVRKKKRKNRTPTG
jgi:hypothetical protein